MPPATIVGSATYSAREILVDAKDIDTAEYDAKTKKRLDNRQRLRDARRREKDEVQRLQHEIAQMAQYLLGQSKPLPWREVARALSDDATASQDHNRSLKRQLNRMQKLVASMATWGRLPASSPSSMELMPQMSGGWRECALLGCDDDSRATSVKWLTERMYHNAEAALAHCQNTVGASTSIVQCTESMVYVAASVHRVVAASLKDVSNTHRRIYMTLQAKQSLDEPFLQESIGTNIALLDAGNGDPMELCRVFSEPQQSVLVSTHVAHDDTRPHFASNGGTMLGWIVDDRLNETFTRVREFWLVGIPVPSSIHALATALGRDADGVANMSDTFRHDSFVAHLDQSFGALMVHCDNLFQATLARESLDA